MLLLGLAELSVQVGEQLVTARDGDRLSDEERSGTGIPLAQTQGQEAAEVGVEAAGRAVTDSAESNAQRVGDGLQGREINGHRD